jgi:hypothetical protein
MHALRTCAIALLMIGCGKADDKPAEDMTVGEAPAAEQAPADIALADVAGKWKVHTTVVGKEDQALDYEMTATGDREGWSIKFPDRDPIPVRVVAVEGDSIISEAGPFESALRKGVQVRSRVVSRLRDGKLVGYNTARYEVEGADTVTNLIFEGTRAE